MSSRPCVIFTPIRVECLRYEAGARVGEPIHGDLPLRPLERAYRCRATRSPTSRGRSCVASASWQRTRGQVMIARTFLVAWSLWLIVPAFAQAPPTSAPPPAQDGVGGMLLYSQMLLPDAIRLVQQRLHDAGLFGGAVNGDWDNDSEHALVTFQQTRGLQTTGQMNQATAAVMGLNPADLLAAPDQASPPSASAPSASSAP